MSRRVLAFVLLVAVAGCSGGDSGSNTTLAEGAPDTTIDQPVSTTAGDGEGGGGWGSDMTGAEICAAGDSAGIEAIVGVPLVDMGPVDSQGVGTCYMNFDAEHSISQHSISVVVWPAESWEGRSPSEAYIYRYDVNLAPGDIEAEDVDIAERATVMVGPNNAWVTVLTGDRVFEVQSSTVGADQLTQIAEMFAAGIGQG